MFVFGNLNTYSRLRRIPVLIKWIVSLRLFAAAVLATVLVIMVMVSSVLRCGRRVTAMTPVELTLRCVLATETLPNSFFFLPKKEEVHDVPNCRSCVHRGGGVYDQTRFSFLPKEEEVHDVPSYHNCAHHCVHHCDGPYFQTHGRRDGENRVLLWEEGPLRSQFP